MVYYNNQNYLKVFKNLDSNGIYFNSSDDLSLMNGIDATSHIFYIATFISLTLLYYKKYY